MSAYGKDDSRILGHLDVSTFETDWSSLIVCPSRYSNEVQEKHLTFSGSPSLSFIVQIDSSPREIKLNEPQTVTVTPENVQIFQFFPPEDIARQLDVTVTSDSADVPAYLKVSRVCKEVGKDGIDEVDYKGESIRLSFAMKGRITLSKVSLPPLTDSNSSWFIGIAIKNATGKTPFNATKSVTLELNKSDFSYWWRIGGLILFSLCTGALIACFAHCCFGDESTPDKYLGAWLFEHNHKNGYHSLPSNQESALETYSYTASIVGFTLMIGAGQFVFANWHLMKEEGDRDNCYYNDFCYKVIGYHDIPLNLMISNLVYICHGLVLGLFVYWRWRKWESEYYIDEPAKRAISIGYAFAWAMIFEGLFSLLYHLCPSKLTFQFDTAFMFVIAGLIVISLYDVTAENPVGAANFFLYFSVPLFIFNYLGALRHSETRLPTPLEICFYIGLAIWFICICIWVGYKVHYTPAVNVCNEVYDCMSDLCKCDCTTVGCCCISELCECDCETFWKTVLFFILVILCPVILFITFFFLDNLPEFFLFSCIAESIIAILMKCISQPNCECKCKCKCPSCEWTCQGLYVLSMVGLWIAAFYFFLGKATTDKAETPENSRNLNHECCLLNFYDYHDVWHILSSHALLMTVCLVIAMSCK